MRLSALMCTLSLPPLVLFACLPQATAQQRDDQVIVIGDPTLGDPPAEAVVSGTVTDEETGETILGVSIYVADLERGAVTDQLGAYRLMLPTGTHVINFQHLGMEDEEKTVTLFASGVLDVVMRRRDVDFDEVVVEATRSDHGVRGVATGVDRVSISDLEQLPAFMGEVDVISSVELLPGVNTVGEGSSGFNVRGGRADQNLILMDGAPLFNASHVVGLFSVFNPDATEGYSLYKGHMPVRYGGRLASVMDVEMRKGSMEEYQVAGGVGVAIGRAMVEGPIARDKTSFLLAGRITYFDWILSMASADRQLVRLPLNEDVSNSIASFYDVTASVNHQISARNALSFSIYGSHDKFRYADRFGFSWSNRLASLKWSALLAENWYSELSFGVNRYTSSNSDPSSIDAFLLENGIGYYRLRENLIYTGLSHAIINAGVEWIRYRSDDETIGPYSAASPVAADRTAKDHGRELSFYLGGEYDLTPAISISAGARYSAYSQLGPAVVFGYRDGLATSPEAIVDTTIYAWGASVVRFGGIEPRLSSRIMITPSSSIKAGYDRTRQYLHQISNSTSPTPSDIWQVSTVHLPPQAAHNYSIGYFRNFGDDAWETSVEFFYRDIHNLVEYRDFARLFMNSHIETELLSAKGKAYGGEFSINKPQGAWAGWLSYSFMRTFVKAETGIPGLNIARGSWFPSNYDQPHSLTLVGRRRLGQRSAFSVNFTYGSGRPITALVSSYQNDATVIPLYSHRNTYRIPDYIRLDVSFTIADNILKNREPNPDRRYKDSVSISIYNVLGRKNAFSVFYQRPANVDIPRAYRLSVLGAIIPSITYNFSF